MTENKRFEVVMNEFDEVEYISDIVDCEDRDFAEFLDFVETVCKENKQLKTDNGAFIQDIEVFKEENTHLKLENEQLKYELDGMEELLKSYRKTIKHDAKLLADATKNGYLPPLDDWEEISL